MIYGYARCSTEPENIKFSGSFVLLLQLFRSYYSKVTYKVVGVCVILFWWSIGESNPWPSQCECDALPTALMPRMLLL